jgi:serine protease Do
MLHDGPVRVSISFIRHFVGFAVVLAGVAAGQAFAQPEKISNSFAAVTKKVEPAVVSIDTKTTAPQTNAAKPAPVPDQGDDLMDFLRRQMQQRPVRTVGSGFIVDKAGYVVTNAHVIDGASRITVKLESGDEYIAKVIGSDDETDLAVLKIDVPRELPFLKFGDSDKAEVGDWVLAIGSPFGLTRTVTAGIISQTKRETPLASAFKRFIQTDAAINRGNSGGPLVNMDGEVIGVNSQIATSTGDYNGVGFALPAKEAEYVLGQIVKNGKVRRGYLGVYLDSVKPEFASVYGLRDARGAIITHIRDKMTPAGAAGLEVGDVIVEFNGQPIESAQDLILRVANTLPQQEVSIKYLREKGETIETNLASTKIGERPPPRGTQGEDVDERRSLPVDGTVDQKPFGLTLAELTPIMAPTYKLTGKKGLVVKEINPTSFIADVKNSVGDEALGEGDLIQRINRVTVTDLKTFNDIVSKLKVGDAVVLHVIAFNPSARVPQLKIVQFTVK